MAVAVAAPAPLPAPDADNGGLMLPPGFRALVYADNLVVNGKVGNASQRLRHIAFQDGWLYHSSRTAVYRYKYTPGELIPSSTQQTVVSRLPAEKDRDAKARRAGHTTPLRSALTDTRCAT